MSNYETLRLRHAKLFRELMPAYLTRLEWDTATLQRHRMRELRRVFASARDTPGYRRRLGQIDPATATEADLASIPPVTKAELMTNFDDFLTDRRLSQDVVEGHLANLTDDAYLLNEFHVVASGGSSGTRGIFIYDREAWAVSFLTMVRARVRHLRADQAIGLTPVRAMVAAGKVTHMTYAFSQTFREAANTTAIPATLPLAAIVERLNALQPVVLAGYPSVLHALAGAALDGRLTIQPRIVGPGSEPLLPEMRRAMEEAWHCPILNVYGTSEGVSAASCGKGRGMHLSEDVAICEPVDRDGRPVRSGERAAKMYVTNLYNHTQPLIRYELTDEVTLIDEPCPCGSAMRRIDDIAGRSDDVFTYADGTILHPLVFRSRLGSERNIIEYQVHQTATGADVSVRVQGSLDQVTLAASLQRDLERAGLARATVTVAIVASFDRQQTGKLKRFFPIDTKGVG